MAVTVRGSEPVADGRPLTTFTVELGPHVWKKARGPLPGDVVVLQVIKPECPVTAPPGWTASPDGRSCYKLWGPHELDTATFTASGLHAWEVARGYVDRDTFDMPPSDSGTTATGSSASGRS